MQKNTFSIKEALSFGWETFVAHLWFFLALVFSISVAFSLLGLLQEAAKGTDRFLFVLINIVAVIINIFIGMGLIRTVLGFIHKEKPSLRRTFMPSGELFFPYVVCAFLYVLIVAFGLVLLIIPGIVWAIKYQLYPFFILDKKLSPKDALKQSGTTTKGVKWKLFGFGIVICVLNAIGALFFGIGLLVTIPVTFLASAFVYQTLALKMESNVAMERLDPQAHPIS